MLIFHGFLYVYEREIHGRIWLISPSKHRDSAWKMDCSWLFANTLRSGKLPFRMMICPTWNSWCLIAIVNYQSHPGGYKGAINNSSSSWSREWNLHLLCTFYLLENDCRQQSQNRFPISALIKQKKLDQQPGNLPSCILSKTWKATCHPNMAGSAKVIAALKLDG